jgi:hypothetical protein
MFPIWAWMLILSVIALIVVAGLNEKKLRNKEENSEVE